MEVVKSENLDITHYNNLDAKDARLHRFFEMMPGIMSWLTLIGVVVLSWITPLFMAIFIIAFDTYWFFKTFYLAIHLRISYSRMTKNMKIDWLKRIKEVKASDELRKCGIASWQDVEHVIIFPYYNEPYEVIKETFDMLIKLNYPYQKFTVILAGEERAGEPAKEVGERLQKEYAHYFANFLLTIHPYGMEGEIPGKGSNESWALKKTKELIIDPRHIQYEKILVSIFDCDTQIFPEYFGVLTYNFLTAEHPLRSSYLPIPFFLNNIFNAPALSRVISFSASIYHMMQQARPHRLTTFSSHTIPFKVLVEVGYYRTNIVNEDSHIFWQSFLHYDGDYRVVPLNYPVSMDANVAPTFTETMKNQYKQQRRWAWGGCENIPFFMIGFIRNKKIPFTKKFPWAFFYIESFHSWATNALIIFSLSWLPILIGGPDFRFSLISYSLPKVTSVIMDFASIGILTSAFLGIVLLPPKPVWFKKYHYPFYVLQWVLLPFTMTIFGSFPALESQTRGILGGKYRLGFWVTPKHREKTEA